jgi:holo-[acyl-carrier protein] synthase
MSDLPGEVRIGVDVVNIEDIRRSLLHFGSRYEERLFSVHERESCIGGIVRLSEGLAVRFAAKEATIKVLRPGEEGVPWRSIEIRRDANGACDVHLSGAAARLADDAGLTNFAVSMSHEGNLAVAVVVATKSSRV